MNHAQPYIFGSYKARILSDGSISYYREILTPEKRELIGREYPNEGYCWFNLTWAALKAGLNHDDIFQVEPAARDLIFNDANIAARLAELEAVQR
jgi:hypothetical protein